MGTDTVLAILQTSLSFWLPLHRDTSASPSLLTWIFDRRSPCRSCAQRSHNFHINTHHHSYHHCNDDSYSSTTMTRCDGRRNYIFLLARASQIDEAKSHWMSRARGVRRSPAICGMATQGKGDQLENFVEQSVTSSAGIRSDCGGQANPQASSARERPAPRVIIAKHLSTRRIKTTWLNSLFPPHCTMMGANIHVNTVTTVCDPESPNHALVTRSESQQCLFCASLLVMLWTASLVDRLRHIPGFEP